ESILARGRWFDPRGFAGPGASCAIRMRQVWRWVWLWLAASLMAMMSSLALAATITGVSPTSGPAGTQVTITGTGFTGTFGVYFDAGFRPATFTVVNDTTITATAPSGVP